jgi:hypothetical protein
MVQDIVNVSGQENGQENGQQLSYANSIGGIPGPADHAAVHRAFQATDHESLIRAAVEASPNKIAIVAVKGPYDHPGWHASDLDPAGFDHVAVAYYDARTQSYKLAEMVPSATLTETGKEVIAETGSPTLGAMLGSENKPGDIAKLSWDYADVAAVPVNLGPEQAGEFLKAVLEKTAPGNTYSFLAAKFFGGETCASSIAQAIRDTLDPHFGDSNFPSLEGLADYLHSNFKLDVGLLAFASFNDVLPSAILKYFADKSGVIYQSQSFVTGTYFGDGPDHFTIADGHAGAGNPIALAGGTWASDSPLGSSGIFEADGIDYAAFLGGPTGTAHAVDLVWHDYAAPYGAVASLAPSFPPAFDAGHAAGAVAHQGLDLHPAEYFLV